MSKLWIDDFSIIYKYPFDIYINNINIDVNNINKLSRICFYLILISLLFKKYTFLILIVLFLFIIIIYSNIIIKKPIISKCLKPTKNDPFMNNNFFNLTKNCNIIDNIDLVNKYSNIGIYLKDKYKRNLFNRAFYNNNIDNIIDNNLII